MALLEEIRTSVIDGDAERAETLTKQALDEDISPTELLNDGLIPAMDEVGVRFQNNDFFLPEVLIAARAMNRSMEILKPLLTKSDVKPRGTIVIGTVKGDRHDIGKNLVAMMMEGAGYEVFDLGVDVSPQQFVDAVKEHDADIVAMSALLTTTMPSMKETLDALTEAGFQGKVKTMVGGAPVSTGFADEIGADAYAADSAAAVSTMKGLLKA